MLGKLGIAIIALTLSCLPVHAQVMGVQGGVRGFDPNAPRHDISGSVINSVTGEPIPRALVQMFGPYQRSDFTDSQGNFHFEGVPEGQAMLMARKPGFFNSQELARGGGPPRSLIKITGDTSSLVLKLTPEGVVTGTITGDDGEPLEWVRVLLQHRVIINGRRQWEQTSQGSTNEDGEFRVANLVPGTYYLRAQASAVGPRALAERTGYPPSYYPGASDRSSAAAIEVRGGQTVQLDFRLRAQPIFEVGGAVLGLPPGERGTGVQITDRAGEFVDSNVRFQSDHTFTARLPAGTYTLRANAVEPQGRALTGSTTITVSGNVSNLRLALQPRTSIPVVVRTEFTKQPAASTASSGVGTVSFKQMPAQYASVQLITSDGGPNTFFYMSSDPDAASFSLRDVEPGRYMAQITPHGPWYVQSATYGPTDLLRDEMVVTPGGDGRSVDIVLRDDGGAITGSVMSDNVAVPAILLAVPERRAVAPQPQYASENGFAIRSLAPGDYLLFAFDSVDGLEFSNRDALEPYVPRATRVSVTANSNATVALTLIKRGEP